MKIKEERLSADLKAGKTENLYFIYGKEPVLINMYADRSVEKTVGADADDFNLQRLGDMPEPGLLTDYVEALPVFSDVKTVLVKDFDPEKCDGPIQGHFGLEGIRVRTALLNGSIKIDSEPGKGSTFTVCLET